MQKLIKNQSRKKSILLFVVRYGSLILMLLSSVMSKVIAQQKRPNFIIILTDDQRFDGVSVNNPIVITPAINKLAENGMQFSHANVVFSLCSPSRAAILTGRYGSANGVLELNSKLNSDEITLAKYLQQNGYYTGVTGKWHIRPDPSNIGFDFYSVFEGNGNYFDRPVDDNGRKVTPKIHCDDYSSSRATDFIRQAALKKQPFFLFHCPQLPHMDNHHTWPSRPETQAKYSINEMPVATNRLDDLSTKPPYLRTARNLTQAKLYGYPDSLAIQKHTLDYYSVITEMDEYISRIFKTLKEDGLDKNTYIFLMGDNGWMLGDHGFTSKVLPYLPSTHVPFMAAGPTIKPSISNAIVLNIDLAPTILDIAGISVPLNMQGKSLKKLMEGNESKVRDGFVYEGLGTYGDTKSNLTYINSKYRYIVTFTDKTLRHVDYEELYNQQQDKDEMINLEGNKNYKKIMKKFRKKIKVFKNTIIRSTPFGNNSNEIN